MPRRAKELLSDARIRAAKPGPTAYKLTDGGGLHLLVTPAGSRLWRLRYGHGATESMVSLGPYPDVSLAAARTRATQMRGGLVHGVTPAAAKREARKSRANTFEAVAREWFAKQRYAPATRDKVEWFLSLLYPHIGKDPVSALEPPAVLNVLRRIESRGRHETAHRCRALVGKVMRYAIATGRAQRDPSADLRDALASVTVEHHAAITKPARVGELLRAIDGYRGRGHPSVENALKLAPLVFVRPGELRGANWSEFDLENSEWRIPADRMKMAEEHVVPLSTQAVAILRALKSGSGDRGLLFPSLLDPRRPISDNTLNAALRRMGYGGAEMTSHGFRSMASTLLNEQGWHPDLIELQLAHKERNKVRAAYNKAQRLAERRKMMQAWADYLDGLKADDGKVVAIRAQA
ncbi:MAG: tyrosine-type recombinase/integrase [Proteobacteria bacterium]|nr:tyrosine-type recombinase/integrase [Pseudomonadota bacterium]